MNQMGAAPKKCYRTSRCIASRRKAIASSLNSHVIAGKTKDWVVEVVLVLVGTCTTNSCCSSFSSCCCCLVDSRRPSHALRLLRPQRHQHCHPTVWGGGISLSISITTLEMHAAGGACTRPTRLLFLLYRSKNHVKFEEGRPTVLEY
jgi:hypothetical protein